MQHAVRYVEEGLLSLTQADADDDAQSDDAPAAASELERELRGMLGAMRAVQLSWLEVRGSMDDIGRDFLSLLIDRRPELLVLFQSFRDEPVRPCCLHSTTPCTLMESS